MSHDKRPTSGITYSGKVGLRPNSGKIISLLTHLGYPSIAGETQADSTLNITITSRPESANISGDDHKASYPILQP